MRIHGLTSTLAVSEELGYKMRMNLRSAPRQADVAKLTGLSQATISRVLHDDPAVLPATKAKVFDACEKLGYRVSVGGRLLAAGRKAIVGLSLSGAVLPTNRYTTIIYQHLAQILHSTGWSTVLISSTEFSTSIDDVGAVILIGVMQDDERLAIASAKNIPAVSIGHPLSGHFSVAPNDWKGGCLAAEYLIANGRRTLAIMTAADKSNDPGLRQRQKGFTDTATKLGASVEEIQIDFQPTATLSGYRSVSRIRNDIDGLFCDTDEAAIGALWALRDTARRVGPTGSMSLIGFDNMPELANEAGLTTISQDFRQIAKTALDLRLLAEKGHAPEAIAVSVDLVVRET